MAGESVILDFLRSQEDKQSQNGQQEKQIVYIDIQNLKASKENFYGIRDLEALKASISLHGLLQPILVIPAEIEGKYTVLGGGRRRQAIEELVDEGMEELRKVPCIISDGRIQGEDAEEQEPDEVKELIGKLNIISANSFREKTDWEKMEETLQIGSIIKELKNLGKLKGNVREMQVELSGIKGTQIARYNAIMNHLSVELMQAFKNNDFGISVAYELSRLPEDYQQQAWELLLENKVLTLSDTERLHNLKKADESLEGQIKMQEFLEQQEIHANNNQEDIQGILTEEKENAAKRTPDPEENAENLPGQTNIEDDPEVLPEKVPYFTKGGEPYGYTYNGVVKEYLQTEYTKDSAKIGFMGKEYLVLRRPEKTFFYDDKGNTLFEVENARLEEEYNWMNQRETSVAPSQQQESLNPITKIPKTMLTYIAEAVIDEFDIELLYSECESKKEFEEVVRNSIFSSSVDFVFCNTKLRAKFLGEIEVIKIATGKGIGTTYTWKQFFEELQFIGNSYEEQEIVAPSQQENEVPEEIYTSKEWTPEEVLEEKREELHRWIEAFAGEEHPESLKKQKIIVDALEYMVKNLKQEEDQQEQSELPKFKNNDQRKEWLRNYQEWGIWYIDEHIGAKYYRYQFKNGAELIVEEYEDHSQYTGYHNSYYYHLAGGPEPQRKNGVPKWNRHEKYSKFPSSETELVEFLKEIQK